MLINVLLQMMRLRTELEKPVLDHKTILTFLAGAFREDLYEYLKPENKEDHIKEFSPKTLLTLLITKGLTNHDSIVAFLRFFEEAPLEVKTFIDTVYKELSSKNTSTETLIQSNSSVSSQQLSQEPENVSTTSNPPKMNLRLTNAPSAFQTVTSCKMSGVAKGQILTTTSTTRTNVEKEKTPRTTSHQQATTPEKVTGNKRQRSDSSTSRGSTHQQSHSSTNFALRARMMLSGRSPGDLSTPQQRVATETSVKPITSGGLFYTFPLLPTPPLVTTPPLITITIPDTSRLSRLFGQSRAAAQTKLNLKANELSSSHFNGKQ